MDASTVATHVVAAFEGLSADLRSIYGEASRHTMQDWVTKQKTLAGGAGGAAMLVPFLHLGALAADVVFLMNRMYACSYGVGSILGRTAGHGNILEKEDFAVVLANWCGELNLSNPLLRGGVVKAAAALGAVTLSPGAIATALTSSTSILVGHSLNPLVAKKLGSKFAGKLAGKAGVGFIPLVGAAIGAGINVWFISQIAHAAEEVYQFKLKAAGELTTHTLPAD